MKHKIELHYTGGGITLAEATINSDRFAVVSSEAPNFLTVYKWTDGETTYLPEDMIFSLEEKDLSDDFRTLYPEMLNELKKA